MIRYEELPEWLQQEVAALEAHKRRRRWVKAINATGSLALLAILAFTSWVIISGAGS